jgi:HD-GYP domain-containing protein (c-di-GMP phosphodiesterase class II)
LPADTVELAHLPFPLGKYIPYHAVNVSIISLSIGNALALVDDELTALGIASLLHCVGRPIDLESKIALHPDRVLKLEGRYINGIEKFPKIGYITDRVREILKEHHIMMGPDGCPFQGDAKKLKLAENILIVADTYCTMLHHPITEKNHYPHTALMWIVEQDGKPFKGEVLKALVETVGLYPIGTQVKLSTGEIGIVVKTEKGYPMRPRVKVLHGLNGQVLKEPKICDLSKTPIIHINEVLEGK